MSKTKKASDETNQWLPRLWRFAVVSTLMGASFVVGVGITGYMAARLLLPVAAAGISTGLAGMASLSGRAAISALYTGDSETRLGVLTQLQQSIDSQPTMTFDKQTSAWVLPAIEQCKTDSDPEVVSLAEQLMTDIKDRTLPPPQSFEEPSEASQSPTGALFQWRDHRSNLAVPAVI